MTRRPPALLPAPAARLGGFAALALLGAIEWQRMAEGITVADATLWVLIAVAAAAGVLWADARPRFRGTLTTLVALAALFGAYLSSGLALSYLKPRRLDDLVVGLSSGSESLATVQMPYAGADPWPGLALALLGAVLCVLAGLLAFWPRANGRGYQFLSLALLLVLVAAPVVSTGGARPVLLGLVLTALTVCFLWLERLPLRPGIGIAAMLALVLAGALPLASAANGEDPWFDYQAFAEGFGPDEPVRFNWGHTYGDITWSRDGSEVLRVDADRPSYWKVADLDDFDGEAWGDTGADRTDEVSPEFDLPSGSQGRPQWRESIRVTLRRIETDSIIASGTTLAVSDAGRSVTPSGEPGLWRAATEFEGGDSYSAQTYTPRATARELEEATSGQDPRRGDALDLTIPTEVELPRGLGGASDAAAEDSVSTELRRLRLRADIRFPPFTPFGRGPAPYAQYQTLMRDNDGAHAMRRSPYAATWRLSRRLARQSRTPYDYVVAVDRYLHDGFRYDETPDPVSPGRAPLDGFLFETKSGYCQHYSAAMALLLRMGGVPARVVTGFSPGGFSERKDAWIVRDTDAHSWVEAWFDDIGWVTFDPTPSATPARSQIAALERPDESDEGDDGGAGGDISGSAPRSGLRPDLLGEADGAGGGTSPDAGADGGAAWWWFVLAGAAVLALIAWAVLRWRRRSLTPSAALDRAIAELECALRRLGLPAAASTTLAQLERRVDRSPEAAGYVRALRAGRYAPAGPRPTPRGRRALRREFGRAGGLRGRLRALLALPPWRP